jgi:hypothetical protein
LKNLTLPLPYPFSPRRSQKGDEPYGSDPFRVRYVAIM